MRACAACGNPVPIRWRNNEEPPQLVHVAGPVICSREWRPSAPRYIVDRRQACSRCAAELVRGRWALFFVEGALVVEHGAGRVAPILHYADERHEDSPRCERRPDRRRSVIGAPPAPRKEGRSTVTRSVGMVKPRRAGNAGA